MPRKKIAGKRIEGSENLVSEITLGVPSPINYVVCSQRDLKGLHQ